MSATNRKLIKRNMKLKRIHKYGKADNFGNPYCDFCQKRPGVEMHEIISRGRTIKQQDQRDLSYQPELCSILCRECHHSVAHTINGRNILVSRNVEIYGKDLVLSAFYRLKNHKLFMQDICVLGE